MKRTRLLIAPVGLGVLSLLLAVSPGDASPTGADSSWRTPLTISEPTEIPGAVLEPGRYIVQVLNTQETRMVVQFLSENPPKAVATVIGVPNYQVKPSDGQFTYFQRSAGSPQALRAWIYQGNNFGVEFVYPKEEAMRLAQASHEDVYAAPAARPELNESVVTISPELTEKPLTASRPPAPQPAPAPVAAQSSSDGSQARTLPATASNLPLLGVLGFAAIGLAALLRGLRVLGTRSNLFQLR